MTPLPLTLIDGVSEWATTEQILATVQPADILEMKRTGYRHYAMFIKFDPTTGRPLCVHVNFPDGPTATAVVLPRRGFKGLQYLDEVIGGKQCRINNKTKEARNRRLAERSIQEQIAAALEGFESDSETDVLIEYPYNLATNNCEVNVTAWKYGEGFSTQVETVAKVALGTAGLLAGISLVVSYLQSRRRRNQQQADRDLAVLYQARR